MGENEQNEGLVRRQRNKHSRGDNREDGSSLVGESTYTRPAFGTSECYHCHEIGHFARECPNKDSKIKNHEYGTKRDFRSSRNDYRQRDDYGSRFAKSDLRSNMNEYGKRNGFFDYRRRDNYRGDEFEIDGLSHDRYENRSMKYTKRENFDTNITYSSRHNHEEKSRIDSIGNFGKSECYYCHEIGHFARECPSRPRHLINNGSKEGCYHCGLQGHILRDCPEKNEQLLNTDERSSYTRDVNAYEPASSIRRDDYSAYRSSIQTNIDNNRDCNSFGDWNSSRDLAGSYRDYRNSYDIVRNDHERGGGYERNDYEKNYYERSGYGRGEYDRTTTGLRSYMDKTLDRRREQRYREPDDLDQERSRHYRYERDTEYSSSRRGGVYTNNGRQGGKRVYYD